MRWNSLPLWVRGGIAATALLTIPMACLRIYAEVYQAPIFIVFEESLPMRILAAPLFLAEQTLDRIAVVLNWVLPTHGLTLWIFSIIFNFSLGALCVWLFTMRKKLPYAARGALIAIIAVVLLSSYYLYYNWISFTTAGIAIIVGTLLGWIYGILPRTEQHRLPLWLKGGLIFSGIAMVFVVALCSVGFCIESLLVFIFAFPAVYAISFSLWGAPLIFIPIGILLTALLYFGIGAALGEIYSRSQDKKRTIAVMIAFVFLVFGGALVKERIDFYAYYTSLQLE